MLDHCMLDMYSQSGLLDHHMQYLLNQGLISKEERTYSLTEKGMAAAKFLSRVVEAADPVLTEGVGEDEKMQQTDGIKIGKFRRDNLESLVDFWIERYEMKAEDRDRVRSGFDRTTRKRNTVRFLAWDSGRVVGFLAGRTVPLASKGTTLAKVKHRGVLGYIESAVVSTKRSDTMEIMGGLVDAHEQYYRSKPNCKGTFVPNVTPELEFSDRMLFHVLQEKGFFVQNISYQMRKDFEPGQFIGIRPPADKVKT